MESTPPNFFFSLFYLLAILLAGNALIYHKKPFSSNWIGISSNSIFSILIAIFIQKNSYFELSRQNNQLIEYSFQVNNLDKLSHLVCNECVRKLENFHCYALMAHKNQELFNIMYSEKIYREHCTALSSLNTTLYREPPTPQVQQVPSKSPNTITIQPTPPIKKQKMQPSSPPQQKPIKLPPTTVITPSPAVNMQQQNQQVSLNFHDQSNRF